MDSSNLTNSLLNSFSLSPTARTDQTRFNTTGTAEYAEKAVASEFFNSTADIEQGAWLMLRDTITSGVSQISFVQIAQDAITGLLEKSAAMRAAIEAVQSTPSSTPERSNAIAQLNQLETDITQYIATNLTARSNNFTIDASQDYDASTTINYIETLRLGSEDTAITDLAVIEIDSNDYMNAFHDAGSCPLCQARADSNPGQAIPYAESANYLAGSGSSTTDITSATELTANTDTNTILMGPYWDDSSLSYSIHNQNDPVGYNYSSYASTVAGAVIANNNMWDYRTDVQAMFSAIEDSSALTFEEIVEDPSTGTVGDLRMAFSDGFAGDGAGSAGAFAFSPADDTPIAGDIWWNDSDPDNFDLSSGTKGFQRGIHEIGHALGLSHPHDSGSYNNSTLAGIGDSIKDNYRYTVMSYNQGGTGTSYYYDRNMVVDFTVNSYNVGTNFASITYTSSRVMPATMMILDVEALEHLYGASTANSTDTTHDVSTYGDEFIRTITDSGGTDTIDASSTARANTINLEAGSLSSINIKTQADLVTEIEDAIITAAAAQGVTLARTDAAVQNRITYFENTWLASKDANAQPTAGGTALYTGAENLAIARSATIENAIGGAANDTINGNASDNQITGGGGDDTIDGGDGTDIAIFSGSYANYVITNNGDGTYTVLDTLGSDGSDRITNIEFFRFADLDYTVSDGQTSRNTGISGGSSFADSGGGSQRRFDEINTLREPPHDFGALKSLSLDDPQTAIKILDLALETLNSERAKLGAIANALQRSIDGMYREQTNIATARSRIMDTDYGASMMKIVKHQIIQSAGLFVLKNANISADQAMRLLR